MSRPRLEWNSRVLDFPEQLNRYQSSREATRKVGTALSGASETAVFRKTDMLRAALVAHTDRGFYDDLQAWWNWAVDGNPFGFAFDRDKRVSTTVNATLTPNTDLLSDGDLEDWTTVVDLTDWTEALGTGGAIVQAPRSVLSSPYIGSYNALMLRGSAGRPHLQQVIPLVATQGYRMRVVLSAAPGASGKALFGVQNATTGNWLKHDGTWGATVTDMPYLDLATGAVGAASTVTRSGEWFIVDTLYTTEGSGTSSFFRLTLSDAGGDAVPTGSGCYWGQAELFKDQFATLTSTVGILAGDILMLRSADGMDGEAVVVRSVASSTVLRLAGVPTRAYAVGDVARHIDYFPALEVTSHQQPFDEDPGLLYTVDLKAREYVSV